MFPGDREGFIQKIYREEEREGKGFYVQERCKVANTTINRKISGGMLCTFKLLDYSSTNSPKCGRGIVSEGGGGIVANKLDIDAGVSNQGISVYSKANIAASGMVASSRITTASLDRSQYQST